jgi:methionyl-tRNA formyltransferase
MTSAVVFAYHNVGMACLRVLLKQGVEIKRVITHADSPDENIWFESVADLARESGIPVSIVEDPNSDDYIAEIAALKPDFLFSFYYRLMLKPALLETAPRGAFNMHGSLLPRYRGRVPINWAIIKGETETGATLHEMVAKPDAGRIVDQEKVAISVDDNALDVFTKVTGAAAIVLSRSLPKLIAGTAELRVQDLSAGSYFGGRKPEDGVINWRDSAENIHNLVRAVAPPYPGATTRLKGETIKIIRTRLAPAHFQHHNPAKLNVGSDTVIALCGDGRMLRIVECEIDGQPHNEVMLAARLGIGLYDLDSAGEAEVKE